jgi:hypothetical protein
MWVPSLLRDIGVQAPRAVVIWCDNIGDTYLPANPVMFGRTKHIEVDYHFIRERVGHKCRSGFMTLPPVPLQEQPVVVFLLEGHRSLGALAIREYGEHEDLCGSGRRSVIPYVHG